jgi:hypothetical protein
LLRKKEKLFLTAEFQQINVKRIMELVDKKYHYNLHVKDFSVKFTQGGRQNNL